jgi:hypothetical protein
MNEAYKGTLLGEIAELAESGDFSKLVLEPVGDGEEVIAEMTDLEKAVFLLYDLKAEKVEAIINDEDMDRTKFQRAKVLKEHLLSLKKLSWELIEDRLGKRESSLGVRDGFKIIEMNEEARMRRFGQQSGSGGRIRIIRLG